MSGLPTRRALRIPIAIPGAMVAITGVCVMVVTAGRVVTPVTPVTPGVPVVPVTVETVWRSCGPSSVRAPRRWGRRGEENMAGRQTNNNTTGCKIGRLVTWDIVLDLLSRLTLVILAGGTSGYWEEEGRAEDIYSMMVPVHDDSIQSWWHRATLSSTTGSISGTKPSLSPGPAYHGAIIDWRSSM